MDSRFRGNDEVAEIYIVWFCNSQQAIACFRRQTRTDTVSVCPFSAADRMAHGSAAQGVRAEIGRAHV